MVEVTRFRDYEVHDSTNKYNVFRAGGLLVNPVRYVVKYLTTLLKDVASFLYRAIPSGVANGYGTIEKIEGNTVAWNQLVDTGIYANVLPYSSAVTEVSVNSDNEIEVKTIATAGASYNRGFKASPFSSLSNIVGHKYLLLCESKSSAQYSYSSDSALMGVTSPFTILDYTANQWCTTGTIITAVNTNNSFILRVSEQPAVGSYFYFRNFQLIDLTRIFGAGNEPTTVAEFEAWREQNGLPSWTDYNAGELLSVKMQSVKSVGFNQWDEQWELGTLAQGQPSFSSTRIRTKNYIPVIGGATYFFKFPWAKFVCSYDDNYNYLGIITITNNIAALDGQVKYLKWSSYTAEAITTYNNDICINLSDPVKNGTYKPYQSDLADIDVTTITGINPNTNTREVMFADGMKLADREGTVKDTLDLLSDTATVNVVSRAYQSGDESDTSVITDGTTTYYALTTPIEYTDLQDANGNPLNPRYKVEQGGTEQVLPVNTSSPTTVAPTLDIVYNKPKV